MHCFGEFLKTNCSLRFRHFDQVHAKAKKTLCNERYQRCWIWKRKQKLKATYLCTPHNLYILSTLVVAPPKIIECIFRDEFMKSTSIWYFNMYLPIHFHFFFFQANSFFELNRLLNTRICAKRNSNVQGNNSDNVLNDFECTAWIKCAETKNVKNFG